MAAIGEIGDCKKHDTSDDVKLIPLNIYVFGRAVNILCNPQNY